VQLFCADALDELAFGPLAARAAPRGGRAPRARCRRAAARGEAARPAALHAERRREEARRHRLGAHHAAARAAAGRAHQRLDPRSQVWLLDVLEDWKREGRTVVMATHDLSAAAESADRIVVLSEDHTVAADGTPEEVLAQRELLLSVNLIHGAHASPRVDRHRHAHAHGPGQDPTSRTDTDSPLLSSAGVDERAGVDAGRVGRSCGGAKARAMRARIRAAWRCGSAPARSCRTACR